MNEPSTPAPGANGQASPSAMNLQTLIVVALRLMVLDFLLKAAVQLTPQVIQLAGLMDGLSRGSGTTLRFLPWFVLGGLFLAAALIWRFAPAIAGRVVGDQPANVSLGTLSLADCYSVAFVGVGILYIASHLPQVLNWAHYFMIEAASSKRDTNAGFNGYDVSQALLTFIVGVVLMVKGRKWAVSLARKHKAGHSSSQE